ncbi:GNAT family N-acetyltransferase [Oceanibium sediminis]|uniref:GNAT family N-acetyltransferase n=1 Tax=Oceanibium sediminis TaxID=2026339 RepID=UPI001E62527C|nr:GNAT family N-acetyltransferase [Oceanibium sediminis]
MVQTTLETPRLILRPLRPSDAGPFAMYCGSQAVAGQTRTIPHPLPPGATEAFIARVLAGEEGQTVWAIQPRASESEEAIGAITVKEDGDLGYWLGEPFWAAGLATEAVEAVVAHAHDAGVPLLRGEVFQDNPASARVLSKAGFRYLGEGQSYSTARNAMVDVWRYDHAANA